MTSQQAFELALEHLRTGRFAEAETLARQLLTVLPGHPDVLHLLGLIADGAGRSQAAFEFLQQAIAANPANPYYHANLAANLADAGKADEAVAASERAIQLKPDLAQAHYNLGNARRAQNQPEAAIAAYRTALRFQPDYPGAHYNLGLTLAESGQFEEAIAAYLAALQSKPSEAAIYNNLGVALHELGRLDEAIDFYRRGLTVAPTHHAMHSNLCYTLLFHPGSDARTIADEHRQWNQRHAEPLRATIRPHTNERSPDRRLRIGCVSPNFRDHVVGRNLLPWFQEHDRTRFDLVCYSGVRKPDAFTARFRSLAGEWHDIAGLTDAQLADRIREDRIDILLDLDLHLAEGRLLVFARRPAPVQATFAGYPGTTGLTTIDYRLTDPHLDPPERDDAFYSEKSLRLPESFWCFDPIEDGPAVNPLPAAESGHVTFGCLNNFCKVNDLVLELWSRVLREVPGSRLLVLSPAGQHRERLLSALEERRVDRSRVDFVTKQPRPEYLALHQRLDLILDTFPYTGHSTTLDALWMGVPVVSLADETVASRGGLSILTNAGLPELVAQIPEDYVRIASALARDLPRLATLRTTVRAKLEASPLMDAPRFARSIEAALRTMWQRWCAEA